MPPFMGPPAETAPPAGLPLAPEMLPPPRPSAGAAPAAAGPELGQAGPVQFLNAQGQPATPPTVAAAHAN
jgi:hypothetical protein